MIWLFFIVGLLGLFIGWLLVAPVELEINSLKAQATFRWISIGDVQLWYQDEWWLSVRVFFFHKTIPFSKMKKASKRSTKDRSRKKKLKPKDVLKKVTKVVRTFQIREWQLAIDSGQFNLNARLYPLNFLSSTAGHLYINFKGDNFLIAKLRGQPLKIIYAFIT